MYFVYFYITGIMTYSQIGVILITVEDERIWKNPERKIYMRCLLYHICIANNYETLFGRKQSLVKMRLCKIGKREELCGIRGAEM